MSAEKLPTREEAMQAFADAIRISQTAILMDSFTDTSYSEIAHGYKEAEEAKKKMYAIIRELTTETEPPQTAWEKAKERIIETVKREG